MADWRDGAMCRDQGAEAWFPLGNKTLSDKSTIEYAKSFCSACPVRTTCLEFAMDNRIKDGIWGGKTEQERKTLERRRYVSRRELKEPE